MDKKAGLSFIKLRSTLQKFRNNRFFISLSLALLIFFVVWSQLQKIAFVGHKIKILVTLTIPRNDTYELFYQNQGGFNPALSVSQYVKASSAPQTIEFIVPKDSIISKIRFDIGNFPETIKLYRIEFKSNLNSYVWKPRKIISEFNTTNQIDKYLIKDNAVLVEAVGYDSYIINNDISKVYENKRNASMNFWISLATSLLISIFVFFYFFYHSIKQKRIKLKLKGITLKTKNKYPYISSYIFILLISLPLLNQELRFISDYKNTENRRLAINPDLKLHNLFLFPERFTRYYEDQFQFRNLLVRINNYFKIKYLKVSPLPEKVILGKDGWFFGGIPNLVEDYRCIYPLKKEQLERIRLNLLAKIAWFKAKGIKYYMLIPPNKNSIYSEFLPDHIRRVNSYSKLDQVIAYLKNEKEIKIIDVRQVLKDAKKKQQVYYKPDIHWNQLGAYLGYYELFREISKDYPKLKPLEFDELNIKKSKSNKGDISQMLVLNDIFLRDENEIVTPNNNRIKDINDDFYPSGTVIRSYESSMSGLKLVMFRDSYGVPLIPLIQYHFDRSIFIWTYDLNIQIIEKEKPDIVIQEFMEWYLVYTLLMDNPTGIANHP
ncbi:hypothetical protein ACFLRZ_04110 [Bacteroidota bacterium]